MIHKDGIGNAVKSERMKQGLTQQQLADKADVGLNFVYQLEKNKPRVQMDSVLKVLKALGYELSLIRTNDEADFVSSRPDPWRHSNIRSSGASSL